MSGVGYASVLLRHSPPRVPWQLRELSVLSRVSGDGDMNDADAADQVHALVTRNQQVPRRVVS